MGRPSRRGCAQSGAAPDGCPGLAPGRGLEGGEIALMDGEGDEAGAQAAARPKVRATSGGVREIGTTVRLLVGERTAH